MNLTFYCMCSIQYSIYVCVCVCLSIVLKAKTEKRAFLSFEIKTINKNSFSYFSFVLALKIIDAQIIF